MRLPQCAITIAEMAIIAICPAGMAKSRAPRLPSSSDSAALTSGMRDAHEANTIPIAR